MTISWLLQSFEVQHVNTDTSILPSQSSLLFLQDRNVTISSVEKTRGGILVQEYDETINLFGSVDKVYQLSDPITVNKLTMISFNIEESIEVEQTSLCFYEDLTLSVMNGCESRCYIPSVGENDVNIGNIFHDRETSIQYMRLKRVGPLDVIVENAKSTVSNLQSRTESTDIFDDFGLCIDPNSVVLQSPQGPSCRCLDGFIASNGGKVQGMYDTCVSCFLLPDCPYDATIIETARENGICAKVSHEIVMPISCEYKCSVLSNLIYLL